MHIVLFVLVVQLVLLSVAAEIALSPDKLLNPPVVFSAFNASVQTRYAENYEGGNPDLKKIYDYQYLRCLLR